ncbi:alpha/beta hydrolase [Polynucleobacter difficilis]|uniref:alpha/beta hydrolase n=1 Tax=Polynucleobacter difficilis TaxID=556054 RepID=UPI000D3B1A23|nr:alpha/beta hydrolase [Polynucleobacter difficilis]
MWNGFSKTDLDRAYNNSLAVPNSADLIAAWSFNSQLARNELGGLIGVPYGQGDYQSYDLFLAGNNAPLIVFVHGGFWQNRSKNDFSFIAPTLVKAGFSVAVLGYTLAPFATIDQIVNDVRSGIRAIHRSAGINYKKHSGMWLIGWSAGAHLITMALNEPCVIGGTGISGIYDLEPMRLSYINDKLNLTSEASLQNSPILLSNHFGKDLDLFVGDAELPELIRQSQTFAEYRKTSNQFGFFQVLKESNHYTIFDELINPEGSIFLSLKQRFIAL